MNLNLMVTYELENDMNLYMDDYEYYTENDKKVDLSKLERIITDNTGFENENIIIYEDNIFYKKRNITIHPSWYKIRSNYELQSDIEFIESQLNTETEEELPF